jgi:hypothetical protein
MTVHSCHSHFIGIRTFLENVKIEPSENNMKGMNTTVLMDGQLEGGKKNS